MTQTNEDFYLRYYVGHEGKFGHEFIEFELTTSGLLRYANDSAYKRDRCIRKEVRVSPLIIEQVKQMISDSSILSCDDSDWPTPSVVGRQEMEVVMDGQHVKFVLSKIQSMGEMEDKGEGMKDFYFLVQDLRALVLSIISLHFKVKPI